MKERERREEKRKKKKKKEKKEAERQKGREAISKRTNGTWKKEVNGRASRATETPGHHPGHQILKPHITQYRNNRLKSFTTDI